MLPFADSRLPYRHIRLLMVSNSVIVRPHDLYLRDFRMNHLRNLSLTPFALAVFALPSEAGALSFDDVQGYVSDADQVVSVTQFSDVYPSDWAYQALVNVVEAYGCVAGYPDGYFRGNQAMTRYEAAALLNACLDRVTELTDELSRLVKEFETELSILKGRVDGLEARIGELEATQFSTTTKLKGKSTFVFGATSGCLLYTSPSPRDKSSSRMPSSA